MSQILELCSQLDAEFKDARGDLRSQVLETCSRLGAEFMNAQLRLRSAQSDLERFRNTYDSEPMRIDGVAEAWALERKQRIKFLEAKCRGLELCLEAMLSQIRGSE